MPLDAASMVRETANAPGTGSLTLLGAPAGYRTFLSAIGNGDSCYVTIRDSSQFEVSVCTLSGGTTLSRDTVLRNSLGTTAKINFSGGVQVYQSYPHERAVFLADTVTGPAFMSQIGRDIATAADAAAARAALGSGQWKEPVQVWATGNVTISNPGTATFDGVTLSAGDRIGLPAQTTTSQNGIYVFSGSSSAMTRAADADTWDELSGAVVVVRRGTVNADRVFLCTVDPGGTLGTTAVAWAQVGAGSIQSSALTALSGTSTDVTGIPAGVKGITIGISGMSTNGTSSIILQLGDSGGVETSGYAGTGSAADNGGVGALLASSGFMIARNPNAAHAYSGVIVLTLMDAATNLWAGMHIIGNSTVAFSLFGAASKALSATLDRIRFTTAGGTETFDAGSVTINWKT
jgi:hypothetical protein